MKTPKRRELVTAQMALNQMDPDDAHDYAAALAVATAALSFAEKREEPVPDRDRLRRAARHARLCEHEMDRAFANDAVE